MWVKIWCHHFSIRSGELNITYKALASGNRNRNFLLPISWYLQWNKPYHKSKSAVKFFYLVRKAQNHLKGYCPLVAEIRISLTNILFKPFHEFKSAVKISIWSGKPKSQKKKAFDSLVAKSGILFCKYHYVCIGLNLSLSPNWLSKFFYLARKDQHQLEGSGSLVAKSQNSFWDKPSSRSSFVVKLFYLVRKAQNKLVQENFP